MPGAAALADWIKGTTFSERVSEELRRREIIKHLLQVSVQSRPSGIIPPFFGGIDTLPGKRLKRRLREQIPYARIGDAGLGKGIEAKRVPANDALGVATTGKSEL